MFLGSRSLLYTLNIANFERADADDGDRFSDYNFGFYYDNLGQNFTNIGIR